MLLAMVVPRYVKLSVVVPVVVTACIPMSVEEEVCIHGLND